MRTGVILGETVFALREFDELKYFEECREKYGITFDYTTDYPSKDNISLAKGYEAVSIITNPIDREMIGLFSEMGVKYLATRNIGYEHIDVEAMVLLSEGRESLLEVRR